MKILFKYWLPVIIYAILIFALSSLPGSVLPKDLTGWDCLLHALEYLPFGFLIARAVKKSRNNLSFKYLFMFSFILVILYSASDEIHQYFVPGRYVSMIDLLCDGIGGMIGARIAI